MSPQPSANDFRVGLGLDAHRFSNDPPIILAGVVVDETRGIEATSDGDVVAHAVCDALLGAAGLGDMGRHFPPDDSRYQGADSMALLKSVVRLIRAAGWWVNNVDVTVIAQGVRVSPHRAAMVAALAAVLETEAVSIKATTTDAMGFTGRDEGLAVLAVATVTI